jgi:hypothetical protein
MIFVADYFGPWAGHKDATDEVKVNAFNLLEKVNALLDEAFRNEIDLPDNPATGTLISGSTYGGFRPQECPQGAPNSSHKVGRGVDIYDPENALDNWITDKILEKYDLYRENPLATRHWCHLSDRAPGSGKRTFSP